MSIHNTKNVQLIEALMHKLWNIGQPGWISGYGKTGKILTRILHAIVNKEEVTVGIGNNAIVPPKTANQIDWSQIEELRQANITLEDLELVRQNREDNYFIVIDLITELLENNFNNYQHLEHHIWKVADGIETPYLKPDSVERVKKANFNHMDFSGILSIHGWRLIGTLSTETNLSAKEIVHQLISNSEQGRMKLRDHVLRQQQIIESDFDRLKEHNVTASDVVKDILRISDDNGSEYSAIRDPRQVINHGFDGKIIRWVAGKMIPKLDHKYAIEKLRPKPAPAPVEVPKIKTAEEIESDNQARENAYQTLLVHFNLEPEDAKNLVSSTDVNDLRSLWNIKINVMPRVVPVLGEIMEVVHGNVQMMEDLIQFEQQMWINATESFRKHSVVVAHGKYGVNMVSVLTNQQSDAILQLKYNACLPLIKPLRNNLTENYKLNHPNETVLIGRDINEFKKLTFMYPHKKMPAFMYNNSNVIAVLNDTEVPYMPYPELYSVHNNEPKYLFEDNALPVRESENYRFNSIIIFDLTVLVFLIAMLAHTMGLRRSTAFVRNSIFGREERKNYKPVASVDLIEEDDDCPTHTIVLGRQV